MWLNVNYYNSCYTIYTTVHIFAWPAIYLPWLLYSSRNKFLSLTCFLHHSQTYLAKSIVQMSRMIDEVLQNTDALLENELVLYRVDMNHDHTVALCLIQPVSYSKQLINHILYIVKSTWNSFHNLIIHVIWYISNIQDKCEETVLLHPGLWCHRCSDVCLSTSPSLSNWH